ncbi:L-threonylcarbamoyladenylate synthase [Corynebacterium uberis]|uniref:L-threonylcarbamoyladenylate synthase n=1 Tax=Corynebacterium TaxID=1716 RepID=UPI001D0BB6BF|nr:MULTISPECIES: L-threonylcarbamoyladenylate synthase [Corynebacterium]MCZ9309046.1 threonylcarbamoyl-AMP synthase [Corynebacterium sp. c6VSa_13]UDL74489.1 threonylcarbamoyl-AMP synthase [Corynebacterium uberis]UDL76676.1 threonylcarbamoyl-AMP synthase [Corynebacterium uberis]UDL78889.1 threonylcarbamoyl-AMP synthase [Corynebacterium uberis]UDL81167.1 threonylcarbamoyl-AMP synthase [Corynebacterium uberis]
MAQIANCLDAASRAASIPAAARAVAAGELVVLPTDTVYGLGADAFNNQAVAQLLATKRRGPDFPVPVLVGSWDTVQGLVAHYSPTLRTLVEAFWPGGLSVVVAQAPSLPWDLGDTRGTVMVRMPNHPVAVELLRQTGPMAVSSANLHGMAAPTSVESARQQLGDAVSVYLDGGEATIGQPSTIVDLSGDQPRVLRSGAVSAERIAEVLDIPVAALEAS